MQIVVKLLQKTNKILKLPRKLSFTVIIEYCRLGINIWEKVGQNEDFFKAEGDLQSVRVNL